MPEMTYEQSLERLNEIVKTLERGESPLQESLTLYEEAINLVKQCSLILEKAEQQVTVLREKLDGTWEEVPFDREDELS